MNQLKFIESIGGIQWNGIMVQIKRYVLTCLNAR